MKPTRALMRKRNPKMQLFSFSLPDRDKENEIAKKSRRRIRGRKHKALGNMEDSSDGSYSSSAPKQTFPLKENSQSEGSVVSSAQIASEEPVLGSQSSGIYSADIQSNSDNVVKNYPDVVPEVSHSVSQQPELRVVIEKLPGLVEVHNKQSKHQGDSIKHHELLEEHHTLQENPEEHHELEFQKSRSEGTANSPAPDHIESSKSSSSTTHRNLEKKNNLNPMEVIDKGILFVTDKSPEKQLPLEFEQDCSPEETILEISTPNRTLVAEQDSSSDSDPEEINFTYKPVEKKTFLLSGKILNMLRKRKERPIYEIKTFGKLKVNFGQGTTPFNVKAVKPPKQTPAVPEERNILLYKLARSKRASTEVTNVEVALTVLMENFDVIRKDITANSELSILKKYEQAVTKDITTLVKRMVKLKEVQKKIRKVERYNKKKSDQIGRAVQEKMRERRMKKMRSQVDQVTIFA